MKTTWILYGLGSIALACAGTGCTSEQFIESLPGGQLDAAAKKSSVVPVSGVRLVEEFEDLTAVETVNVPNRVDLLWMVDNSPSMGDNQAKLANDFITFADTYLNSPDRDLRIARITSDAYKADQTGGDCSTYPKACDSRSSKLLVDWADGTMPQTAAARSGRPILTTFEPIGFNGDWITQLKADFSINMLVGVAGHPSERGMQSVSKFLTDNEGGTACDARGASDPECFFRKNTIRGIIMLSDEFDGSDFPGAGHPALTNVKDPTVVSYNVGVFKNQVDTFFKNLDSSTDPNYFVTSIVDQSTANAYRAYNSLVDAVAADASNSAALSSKKESIASASYASILQDIGNTISQTQSVTATSFTLAGVPDSVLNVSVAVVDSNGIEQLIPNADGNFVLQNGNVLHITFDILQAYPGAQKVLVEYTPQ